MHVVRRNNDQRVNLPNLEEKRHIVDDNEALSKPGVKEQRGAWLEGRLPDDLGLMLVRWIFISV